MTPARPPAVRVLVIGAGAASFSMHLPVLGRLRDRGEVALALICDLQRERATAARHAFGFLQDSGDAAAALERVDIDAVYILGSTQLHYEYGLRALRNGKHLFVEKPIAPSYAQALELAQAAQERGLIAAGGHNRRFYKSLLAIQARAGKTGWRFAEAVFHKPEFGKPPLFGARTWLGTNGIHALDALVFMMGGLPERLTALTEEARTAPPSAFSALMRWRDGGQGVFLCNNTAGSRREEYIFHALGETCTATDAGLVIEKGGAATKTALPTLGDGIKAEHEAFLRAVRDGAPPPHSIDAIAPSLFLAELIENGFSGLVQLPALASTSMPTHQQPSTLPSVRASPRVFTGASILVVQPATLQPALMRLLPQYRFVSLEDVQRSAGPRPDVAAVILGRGSSALPSDLLAKLPALVIVGIAGLSPARYAPQLLLSRDIALVNASAAYAESVAEFALGLAILGRRRAFLSHEAMRKGGWGTALRKSAIKRLPERAARRMRPLIKGTHLESALLKIWRSAHPPDEGSHARAAGPRELRGASAGLIGWGTSARAFAVRLAQAGAHVRVYSEHAATTDIIGAGATPVSLAEALAADIVSLHRGLSQRTWHFLAAAELARIRAGAVLINVARGALIEPAALLARLKRGDIFACLDTYQDEPLPASHPLRRLPNVFLTSHIAGGSADMHTAAAEEVVSKVAAYLAGQSIAILSTERLRTMT